MTRILILDDEPEMPALLASVLACAGYECLCSNDSSEALSILKRDSVDLLIQDCLRPDPNGFELYEILKADPALRSLPVLFHSALGPEETAEMRSAYCDEHLQMPTIPQELLTSVTSLLRRAGKHVPTPEERWLRYQQERGKLQSVRSMEGFEKRYREIDECLTQLGV